MPRDISSGNFSPAEVARLASLAEWSTFGDPYATAIVGTTGKTQAQLDAAQGAIDTATMINQLYPNLKSIVDPNTGYVVTTDNTTGQNIGNYYTPPTDNPVQVALLAALSIYRISGLADTLKQIRMDYPNISSEDMLTLLRNDARYNKGYLERFAGNAKLIAAGKAMLSEKDYLANETAYEKIFKAYGVDRFANTSQYATLIGNELAPDEVGSRVSMAYNRILNADSNVLAALRKFGSSLSTGDLVAAMLDPKNQLPALEKKITSAEIGGAALKQGLQAFEAATTVQSQRYSNVMGGTIGTEAAMQSGETGAQANADYQAIATELPRMEFLSSISSGMPQYGQVEAEKARIQGLASEQRKKENLIAVEEARYQAKSGVQRNTLEQGSNF